MNCQNRIIYQITQGDTLYKIAQKYRTTPDIILQLNKGLEPYNLQIGMNIIICPETNIFQNKKRFISLNNEMRALWEQHVWWTRMLVLNIIDGLDGETQTVERLLKNPVDIGKVFELYYGERVKDIITKLITEHLVIGADLIKAVRNNNAIEINKLNNKWYKNADDIANALGSINNYYNVEILKKMLYSHLELTKKEVNYRLNKQYQEDVVNYDNLEIEGLMMADYFSEGIYRQFINNFK